MDSVSYAYGISLGNDFKNNKVEGMNPDLIAKGMKNVADTAVTPLLSDQEAQAVVQKYAQYMQEQQRKEMEAKYAEVKAKGIAYLEANKLKEGVMVLPSGIQYEVIKEGTGEIPNRSSTVDAHYTGTLIDGTVFDSSIPRGKPLTIGVTQVIRGWTEVLLMMPVGSKWKVTIPYELAYGPRGSGKIPPYSTLIFEMELVRIVK
ncbi:MAG: FKBP-type peptidyl-prolyl cis-trans isomerase [Cytophagales bacterium]|nr:FKBP-type peptidyl-prolyl cis-trans isomerase [Cytophagales bacterium]